MDIEGLFRHKAFTQLAPDQLQMIKQFARDIQGKGTVEISRLYMQLNQRLNQVNPISAAQRSAIIEAIRDFLPEKDKHKVNGFVKMFGGR